MRAFSLSLPLKLEQKRTQFRSTQQRVERIPESCQTRRKSRQNRADFHTLLHCGDTVPGRNPLGQGGRNRTLTCSGTALTNHYAPFRSYGSLSQSPVTQTGPSAPAWCFSSTRSSRSPVQPPTGSLLVLLCVHAAVNRPLQTSNELRHHLKVLNQTMTGTKPGSSHRKLTNRFSFCPHC